MTQSSVILTLLGPDRPGLVRILAELVAAHSGTWRESRMARLAGQFAGIVQVGIAAGEIDGLAAALDGLQDQGLKVTLHSGAAEPPWALHAILLLEVVGHDRPGIVRDFTQALWNCGVNIEELTTDVLSGSFSGEPMFRAEARLRAPSYEAAAAIRAALEPLGNELMVDIKPAD